MEQNLKFLLEQQPLSKQEKVRWVHNLQKLRNPLATDQTAGFT